MRIGCYLSLLYQYSKLYSLQLFRNRSATLFSIVLPVILFVLIGHQSKGDVDQQVAMLIIFCNYSVQTATFVSLGLTISAEKKSDWSVYLRTLPARHWVQFSGLIVSKVLAAAISLVIVILASNFILQLSLPLPLVGMIFLVALLGAIPMSLLGIGFGHRIDATAARGVMVFVNLGLLFGAFVFPGTGILHTLQQFVPTYQWMLITYSHVVAGHDQLAPWAWLVGWTAVFYWFAAWSARNADER